MKKLFCFALILALVLSLFTFSAFAEETGYPEVENTENTANSAPLDSDTEADIPSSDPTTSDNALEDEKGTLTAQILSIVSDGKIWTTVGLILSGVIAVISAISSNYKAVKDGLVVLNDFIKGKATKEETEIMLGDLSKKITTDFKTELDRMNKQYSELSARNEQLTAVLSLVAIQLVKSPNARTQIMQLISGVKDCSGDVAKLVENIEEEIIKADAEMEKPDTPALDAVMARVEASDNEIMKLG